MQGENHLSALEVSAFIDGELPASEAQTLEQHVTTCHACALSVVSAMRLKSSTTRLSPRFAAPTEALNRLTAQLRRETSTATKAEAETETPKKTARVIPFPTWAWSALAATLILGVSLLGWKAMNPPSTLSAELLDQHLAALSSGSEPEVISSDRHTVKPWFQGKLPFSFNIPEVFPSGTILKGGDLTFVHGQPAALLLFTVGKHQASVFLTQHPLNPNKFSSTAEQSGFTIQYATTQALYITAVSDVNPTNLAELVSALVNAQSPH
ncbi:anti-sigma factor family protein [Terriglobus roseus]|uniref:Transmembrane transcriptional regulator (Anti-sigma factor RsiW) n=1 Tax=Terriglobus roseus TaxID=392734 RepID=A0A1G7K9N5_9BACT|nr:zf-HC2 domain-containing protein [Terriglobus roseus]SDF33731.1 Transmembrane transcriptional regulator (anti-sigma factor RsiW) [Terriglobus roseus]